MAQSKNLFVYYDPEYDPGCTWSWIYPHLTTLIVDFLTHRGFHRVNAYELRDVMASVVKREREKTVVVFAQDVAPETVLEYTDASALIRQYLDNGGSVVWIGDIPFYYQAKQNGEGRDPNFFLSRAASNIISVNPVSAMQIAKTKITNTGRTLGLKKSWTGVRPILKDNSIKALAETKCTFGISYFPIFQISWLKRLTAFHISVFQASFGISMDKPIPNNNGEFPAKNIVMDKKVANAWFKNFDINNPSSGFLRIWDYRPYHLLDMQLEELYLLAISTLRKKSFFDFIITWFRSRFKK